MGPGPPGGQKSLLKWSQLSCEVSFSAPAPAEPNQPTTLALEAGGPTIIRNVCFTSNLLQSASQGAKGPPDLRS